MNSLLLLLNCSWSETPSPLRFHSFARSLARSLAEGYFLLEVGDVGTDLANPIEVALTLQPGRGWFLALIIVVGILALVQAYISIPVRRKMLKHYQGIIDGDMLHIYAKAEFGKKEEGEGEGTVGEENLKVSTGINGGGCERS